MTGARAVVAAIIVAASASSAATVAARWAYGLRRQRHYADPETEAFYQLARTSEVYAPRFWSFLDEDGDPIVLDATTGREYGFTGSASESRLRRLAMAIADGVEYLSRPEGFFDRTSDPEPISTPAAPPQ